MTTSRGVGRPRDAAVEAGLLVATQDLLMELGYDRLSIDAVAARAGASKHTIYRRWANKAELVVAAVAVTRELPPVPDTGSLRGDLLACARAHIDGDERTERLLAGLLGEMQRNETIREAARTGLGAPYADLFRTVLHRAASQDLLPDNLEIETVAAIFPAMAFHSVVAQGKPVDESLVHRVIDGIVVPLVTQHSP
jgi:AcrR family transcriptional regulator